MMVDSRTFSKKFIMKLIKKIFKLKKSGTNTD